MKFATFEHEGKQLVGRVSADGARFFPLPVTSMLDLIERYEQFSAEADTEHPVSLRLDDVRLLAPIPNPRKNIFCVGKNYREHAYEFSKSGYEAGAVAGSEVDDYPAVFTKPATSVVGPNDAVSTHPQITNKVDYEGEIAVVIGRAGRDIKRADAAGYIWGFTIINDVTARDRQKNHRQWFLGKSLDTFCPMGPFIVTSDELRHDELSIRTWVNGELRQDAHTRDLIFDIPTLIEVISAGCTLEPGDIISTGTPAGVGIGFTPPRFLASGDVVEIEVEGIGRLKNHFV
ncbi:fumarylacetoacetate hydrolase family protein [Burkholderia sp. Ac-20365]|jgi:2-keto-4-pentenoate hydratase/2-oxohepta-3-ene-1,7-dioic acid hydratase in catechol pathway|uniref:fumarylacetoacetate hydrolase family protein n=1 Tax=Burkholderia sp. Ac-20365 TaxID=2703897 RepID=UPI00197BCD2D|nr:fumarylacetoacetate hydrolase family protein [Burkholderia sp. Ac-20365]MBN3761415.1 fumarylacetoacetate hydrolase family protein [Burkholderia sp. Ac-20365]